MPKKILVIEDEPGIRKTCKKVLAKINFEVTGASNFKQGIELLTEENWSLVIIDIQLPDGNGIDLLKECVENHPRVIPIMLSGASSLQEAVKTMKIGARDFITKPFDIKKLRSTVKEALN
ncbi:MAG: response regulator [Elusimicrobiota bacterium]